MKERPVIFSSPMVRAILNGTKCQTRRVVKRDEQGRVRKGIEAIDLTESGFVWYPYTGSGAQPCPPSVYQKFCPYGKVGDHLWVRETHATIWTDRQRDWHTVYAADGVPDYLPKGEVIKWRPSIHMPRAASRITLEITGVRVERVQQIHGRDAKAEGANPMFCYGPGCPGGDDGCNARGCIGYREWYRDLWDSINAQRGYSWSSNCWVWVLEFRRLTP